jgi:small RNA 2'-O-methyltransferase
MEHLRDSGAETVLDLGCGAGAFLRRLVAEPQFRRIVGVDSSAPALLLAEQLLAADNETTHPRLSLQHGSVTDVGPELAGFDAAVMIELIEHLDPADLGQLERCVFGRLRPRVVVITTPNREYNTLHGVPEGQYRHPDHRFEWDRKRFERWASGVARRNQYTVAFEGIGPANVWFGSSSQLAIFRL